MASNDSSTKSLPSHTATSLSSANVKTDTARSFDTPAAHHAMQHTSGWTPKLDRRQSWSKEDQKRALQMTGIADGDSKPL